MNIIISFLLLAATSAAYAESNFLDYNNEHLLSELDTTSQRLKRSPQQFQTLLYRRPPPPPPRPIRVRRSVDEAEANDFEDLISDSEVDQLAREKRSPQQFQTLAYRRPPPPPPRPMRARRSVDEVEANDFEHFSVGAVDQLTREKRSPQQFQTLVYRRPPPPPPRPMRARRSVDEVEANDFEHLISDSEDDQLTRQKRSPQQFQTLAYRRPPPPPPRPMRVRRSFDEVETNDVEDFSDSEIDQLTREKRSPQQFQTLAYRRPPPPPQRPIRVRRSVDDFEHISDY